MMVNEQVITERQEDEQFEAEPRYYENQALNEALTLLAKMHDSYQDMKIDPILDLLDGDVATFLERNHPDYIREPNEP